MSSNPVPRDATSVQSGQGLALGGDNRQPLCGGLGASESLGVGRCTASVVVTPTVEPRAPLKCFSSSGSLFPLRDESAVPGPSHLYGTLRQRGKSLEKGVRHADLELRPGSGRPAGAGAGTRRCRAHCLGSEVPSKRALTPYGPCFVEAGSISPELVTNVQSSTLISTSRRYRWAVDAYSTYNGTHPRGHYRPGGRSTWPKGPCGRVADENTPSTSLD